MILHHNLTLTQQLFQTQCFDILFIFIGHRMPKQVIINMDKKYPFGECAEGDDQTIRVLVRRQVEWGSQPQGLLERAYFFRRLNQNCIIRLEQILQEQECMHLLYEYVPIRMQTWISNINEKFIEGFCKQLIELGEYLAKCYIKIKLTLDNVGMDQNYRPKYFLDLDFDLDESYDKQTLRQNYHQQILNLFRPYVQNSIVPRPYRPRQIIDSKGQSPSKALVLRNAKDNASTASSTLRLKEKAAALQKQRKNQSINVIGSQWDMIPAEKNRKQSILSSVSNVKINRLGRRIDEIKSKLKGIYSPEPINLRYEERSIEKNPNSIAFNWDSTERVYTNSVGTKNKGIEPQLFCQSIMRDLQQEETIFQKFEKNLTKQLTKGLPMKKNQTLKAKEYQQMKKSDDGYFKDFFQVLEDKPKVLAIQGPSKGVANYNPISNQKMLSYEPLVEEKMKLDKPQFLQLENRVKSAINKSKKLIDKFKAER